MSRGSKSLEFDRNGIPIFHGEVELLEEYKERTRDIFYRRTGLDRQRSSAIDLRQDDAVKGSNKRGTITFANAGPDTRTTQVFINFGNNANLEHRT